MSSEGINLAIIPARGGSKGIPKKNLVKLNGKPLIQYTIEAALAAVSLDQIIVSSDDNEILALAEKLTVKSILRPNNIATDTASSESVITHAINIIDENIKTIIFLQPTSPLRVADDIDQAMTLYKQQNATSLISVCLPTMSPFKCFTTDNNGYLHGLIDDNMPFQRRQDLPEVWQPNGAIYIVDADYFKESQSLFSEKTVPYPMSQQDSIDIDTEDDLLLAAKRLEENT